MADDRRHRALVLINPRASRAADVRDVLVPSLRSASIEPEIHEVSDSGSTEALIQADLTSIDSIILVGGDGTLNRMVEAVVASGKPLGIIPAGTGNDLARTLGIPLDVGEAARVIGAGHRRRIDLGWVNGKYFFNAATCGLSVTASRRLKRRAKRRWGILSYLVAFIKTMWAARPIRASIAGESGTRSAWTLQIVVGNGPYYGGGMIIHEGATLFDGLLHLQSLELRHWLEWILLFPVLRFGRARWSPHVHCTQGHELEIFTRAHHPICTDGEITTQTPATLRVVREALEVFVPSWHDG